MPRNPMPINPPHLIHLLRHPNPPRTPHPLLNQRTPKVRRASAALYPKASRLLLFDII
jgi:hypothetical protein